MKCDCGSTVFFLIRSQDLITLDVTDEILALCSKCGKRWLAYSPKESGLVKKELVPCAW